MASLSPVGVKTIDVFLSFAELDLDVARRHRDPVRELWSNLQTALDTSGSYRWRLWRFDENLMAGDDFDLEIRAAIARAELGIFALSSAFLTRPYIQRVELPPFLAPASRRRIVPILLKALPREADLRGLQPRQIFGFHEPYWSGRAPHARAAWANRLADELHRVARRDGLGH
jgi:hypothetical protein